MEPVRPELKNLVKETKAIHTELQNLLKNYLIKNPGGEPQLSEKFLVSIPTIKRWIKGENLPATVIAKQLVKHLKKKVEKPVSERQLTNLLALKDAVLEDYADCEKACENDSEFTTRGGNGVNCSEAISTLRPLYELAKKCK